MKYMYKGSDKICSFYISEAHLVAILIPYIYKNIEEGNKIETFFEDDLEEIFKKINLSNAFDKREFNVIDWKKLKQEELSKKFESDTDIIIVGGKMDFINHINRLVLNFHTNFTLVNCYNVNDLENNIKCVMEEYEKILYTSGVEEIGEVFTV